MKCRVWWVVGLAIIGALRLAGVLSQIPVNVVTGDALLGVPAVVSLPVMIVTAPIQAAMPDED